MANLVMDEKTEKRFHHQHVSSYFSKSPCELVRESPLGIQMKQAKQMGFKSVEEMQQAQEQQMMQQIQQQRMQMQVRFTLHPPHQLVRKFRVYRVWSCASHFFLYRYAYWLIASLFR